MHGNVCILTESRSLTVFSDRTFRKCGHAYRWCRPDDIPAAEWTQLPVRPRSWRSSHQPGRYHPSCKFPAPVSCSQSQGKKKSSRIVHTIWLLINHYYISSFSFWPSPIRSTCWHDSYARQASECFESPILNTTHFVESNIESIACLWILLQSWYSSTNTY